MESTLQFLDWVVLAVYFLVLAWVVWWSSKRQDTTEDYFLAGRNIGWFVVGASLFASNIGSEHIVGLAGNGASSGMAMAHWELHAWIMVILGWVFVPFYYKSGVYTMPEFLERRFGSSARWILSIVSLVAYVFTKVSVTVYAGALVFQTLLPELQNAFWIGAFTTVILTGIYTVFGGMRAVVYTDTAQAIILIVGSAFITYFGLTKLGGWGELQAVCSEDVLRFSLWKPLSNPDFPWLGVMIASPIIGIWYWCTDQYIVQRTLTAKNLTNARRGALWGGFLKVWPVFIFLIPGMIGYALHAKGFVSIPLKEDGVTVNGDMVFPTMVSSLLPAGLRGLVVGGLLAALMSSLSSLFNSCASLYTVDIHEKLRPNSTEKERVRVGRIATVVIVAFGIIWIPVMKQVSQGGLYVYLQSVQGYLAPPITAVFLLGLFWKRINKHGATWGLGIGFLLGMLKLTIQATCKGEDFTGPAFLNSIAEFNFLYATGVLFAISLIIVIAISLMTKPQSDAQLAGLTYSTIEKDKVRTWTGFDIFLTVLTLGLVLGVYLYFSFWI